MLILERNRMSMTVIKIKKMNITPKHYKAFSRCFSVHKTNKTNKSLVRMVRMIIYPHTSLNTKTLSVLNKVVD